MRKLGVFVVIAGSLLGDSSAFEERLSAAEKKMAPHTWIEPVIDTHVWIAAEVFAWQPSENGLPVAIKTRNSPNPNNAPNSFWLLKGGQVKNLEFDWDPGFRVGINTFMPLGMEIGLTWLRFFSHAHRNLHAGKGQQLWPVQLHPLDGAGRLPGEVSLDTEAGPSFSTAKGYLYAHLNQLDLDLAKPFLMGKWLGLRPYVGLRTTWLQQRLSVNYKNDLTFVTSPVQPGDNYDLRKKTQWWGIGPSAGVRTSVKLPKGFSFIGLVAGSLEYGVHHLKEKDVDATVGEALVDVKDHFWMLRPILDVQLGMGWEQPVGKYCLHLEGGWELHVYYSQNQFPFFYNKGAVGNFTSHQGDLSYQGWRGAIQWDF